MTDAPVLDVLHPRDFTGPLLPDDAEAALTHLYRYPGRPWLRANMISSLDGAATGPDGLTGSINGPADLRVFTTLRALADVVVVGAGTVRAEGYGPPRVPSALRPARRDRGQADDPALAILTRTGHIPDETLSGPAHPWVFTTTHTEHLPQLRRLLPADHLHVHEGHDVDLGMVGTTLADAGLPCQLTEGGPRLLGGLVAAGALDELCLTWSPVLVAGSAQRVLDHPAWLDPTPTLRLGHLLHSDGVLIGRWLVERAPTGHV